MSTRTGFTRMDWDTGFLADPKFQHLRDLLPDPIQHGYAGFCYLRLAADAWRTCDRERIGTVVRGIEPWASAALSEAGLLDDELRIPEATFDNWTGSALRARQITADAQKRSRESRNVTVTQDDSGKVTRSQDSARTGRTGRAGKVEPVEQDADTQAFGLSTDEVAVFAAIAKAGAFIRPESGMGLRVVGLIERQGSEPVTAELARIVKTAGRKLSDRQIVFGLEAALESVPTRVDAREQDIADASDKRSQRIAEQMHARRVEQFRWTGKWEPEWGPEPVADSVVRSA